MTESQETTLSTEEISNMNVNEGTVGDVVQQINQHHVRRAAANNDHEKQRKKQEHHEKGRELANMHGRLTSGNLYHEGCA